MTNSDDYADWFAKDYARRIKRMQKGYDSSGRTWERNKEYREKNPIKTNARYQLSLAINRGAIVKPDNCEGCGIAGRDHQEGLEGHHCDYAKPLDVMWLCGDCHREWHRNNTAINGDKPVGMLDRFDKYADKTFADACEMYLSEFEGKCRKRQEYALKHLMPYIGDLPLIDVDDQAISEFKQQRRQQAMAGTINKEIGTATAVLNKAAKVWRWIPSAPKLQRVKGDHRKPYPLSWHEQIEVFKRLCGDIQKICLFMVNTGVRREEVFKLRWDDFRDIDGVHLFILRDTKNGQDRPVILNSIAQRIVGYMKGRDETYVFPHTTLNKIVNLAWVEAGLPDDPLIKKGVHNLRHTFGYRLRQAGVPGEDRDALLGHHNQSLTQHYAIPDIKRLAELAERVTVRKDVAVLR